MHLRSAVLSVTLFGVAPFSLYFFFAEQGHFRAAAIHLALVSLGMIVILMIYNRDFANLVSSRRSLLEKQEETQRLSGENLRLANLDALSGLRNRRALMSQLEGIHRASGEAHTQTAVIFVDLDDFKDVKGAYGHETGDRVIEIVAGELQSLLPEDAVLARLGGDEFAALISGSDAAALADMFAARVVSSLNEPIRIGERAIQIGASVGIACAAQGACDARELFRRADAAMYDVKANGKAGVRVYSAALDAARHRQQELLHLSVNVSLAQFRDPDFEAKIADVLAETGFPPARLEFELTEGYLIDHPERAMAVISSLKGMGISIALDDFGTGYTSISYLQRYGFDRIKIDKSLAGRIATDKKAGVLVAGAIYIANGLDMAVTAEGVETEEQAHLLRLAGCQCLQGSRYSKPKPIDEIRDWITKRDAAA